MAEIDGRVGFLLHVHEGDPTVARSITFYTSDPGRVPVVTIPVDKAMCDGDTLTVQFLYSINIMED